jgi:hypothetical protein
MDYACNEVKVREAIRDLEEIFPPTKNEEALSMQFCIQSDKEDKSSKSEQPSISGGGQS